MGADIDAQRLAQRLNIVPVAVMAAGFLSPVVLFWGAAFGPLRPVAFSPVAPALALLAAALCCAFASIGTLANDRYFTLRRFEDGGRFYRLVGVRFVRRLISDGDLINRAVRAKYPGYRAIGKNVGLLGFEATGRAAEKGHLVLLLGGLATSVFAALLGEWGWAIIIAAGNIVANLFPILLQRYNRGRIGRIAYRSPRLDHAD